MKKVFAFAAAASLLAASNANAQWVITMVLDGNISSNPKAVEIKNVSGGPIDLSSTNYYVLIYNNARAVASGPSATNNLNSLTGGATIANGESIFIYEAATSLATAYPNLATTSGVTEVDGNCSINGDDTIVVSSTTDLAGLIDYYGEFDAGFTTSVDGTGRPWEYVDSAAIRNAHGVTTSGESSSKFNIVSVPSSGSYEATAPLGANSFVPVELDSFVID